MSDHVVVKDSQQDMELLYKSFPHLRRPSNGSPAKVGAFGPAPYDPNGRLPFEPEVEGDDYIPPAGKSTYRGSRAITDVGTPADVVRREYYSHAELVNGRPRIFHPEVLKKIDKTHVNFDMGPITGTPPKQEDFFTQNEEGKRMVKSYIHAPSAPTAPPNPAPPVMHPHPTIAPPPPPPKDASILPPLEPTHKPTSDDIVKVLGWNETNMKLMTEVSKRIGRCSELLMKINSSKVAVDVDELMAALQYIDNEAFRKVFADIFQKEMQEYMALSNEIQSYLNGTAVIDPPAEEPVEEQPSDNNPASEGNVSVVSADSDSSQNTSDQSVSSDTDTSD